ncbi:MAG: hypothetical protein ACHP7O_11955 [Burkholderiales bacterium]
MVLPNRHRGRMPRNIEEGFADFLNNLKATAIENEAAKRHRASTRNYRKSNFCLSGVNGTITLPIRQAYASSPMSRIADIGGNTHGELVNIKRFTNLAGNRDRGRRVLSCGKPP